MIASWTYVAAGGPVEAELFGHLRVQRCVYDVSWTHVVAGGTVEAETSKH